jgi:hypothetical protein
MKNPNQTPSIKKSAAKLAAVVLGLTVAGGVSSSGANASSHSPQEVSMHAEHNNPQKETSFQALTKVVANLENGGQAEVAANNIVIPGPIGNAEGQPIVFTSNGHQYFAYTQEQEPNFDQKRPADVAGNMAIVREPAVDANMPLEEAHLDKSGILVDENEMAVGYSFGDTAGK